MKAQALNSRLKEKDAYDIYYCLTRVCMQTVTKEKWQQL